ncbi:MAG: hypothetical protein ABIG84_01375 [archaeon]
MASSIYDFVFYEILKYDYSSSVLTGELQNDIIFGLLVPTIFIAIVAHQGVHRLFGDSSKFVAYLSSITSVGVVITLGWVPIIAGIGGFIFVALIAVYFMYAFYRRIFSEGHEKAISDKLGKAGEIIGNKIDFAGVTLTKKEMREAESELGGCFHRYGEAHDTKTSADQGLSKTTAHSSISAGGGGTNNEQGSSLGRQSNDAQRMMDDIATQAVEIVKSVPSYERGNLIARCLKDYKGKKEDIHGLLARLRPWTKEE